MARSSKHSTKKSSSSRNAPAETRSPEPTEGTGAAEVAESLADIDMEDAVEHQAAEPQAEKKNEGQTEGQTEGDEAVKKGKGKRLAAEHLSISLPRETKSNRRSTEPDSAGSSMFQFHGVHGKQGLQLRPSPGLNTASSSEGGAVFATAASIGNTTDTDQTDKAAKKAAKKLRQKEKRSKAGKAEEKTTTEASTASKKTDRTEGSEGGRDFSAFIQILDRGNWFLANRCHPEDDVLSVNKVVEMFIKWKSDNPGIPNPIGVNEWQEAVAFEFSEGVDLSEFTPIVLPTGNTDHHYVLDKHVTRAHKAQRVHSVALASADMVVEALKKKYPKDTFQVFGAVRQGIRVSEYFVLFSTGPSTGGKTLPIEGTKGKDGKNWAAKMVSFSTSPSCEECHSDVHGTKLTDCPSMVLIRSVTPQRGT